MKKLIASHVHNIYLKPGEVHISQRPELISTVLGSCVAVTLYSAVKGYGAICHAMLPENFRNDGDLRYVDTALHYIYESIQRIGIGSDLTVKLFGGAQVLDVANGDTAKQAIGDQNVAKAEAVLADLGFTVDARDTGGIQGRKLFFCTRSGDVFLRRMRMREQRHGEGMKR